jgi:hypothetical protein
MFAHWNLSHESPRWPAYGLQDQVLRLDICGEVSLGDETHALKKKKKKKGGGFKRERTWSPQTQTLRRTWLKHLADRPSHL